MGNYTGAVLSDKPDEWIPGELFELEDTEILAKLDSYEGSDYVRELVSVMLDDGRELKTWVYLYSKKVGQSPR